MGTVAYAQTDYSDCLLLVDSTFVQKADANFYRLAEYMGLTCKGIDLAITELTHALLKDEGAQYFKAVCITAYNLENHLMQQSSVY